MHAVPSPCLLPVCLNVFEHWQRAETDPPSSRLLSDFWTVELPVPRYGAVQKCRPQTWTKNRGTQTLFCQTHAWGRSTSYQRWRINGTNTLMRGCPVHALTVVTAKVIVTEDIRHSTIQWHFKKLLLDGQNSHPCVVLAGVCGTHMSDWGR